MHTSPPALPEFSSRNSRDLDVGCRVGFLVLTAILTYAAIYVSRPFFSLNVANLFDTMFKGQPLPASLRLVEAGRAFWLPLSCFIPVVALTAGLAIRRPLSALLVIAVCNLTLAAVTLFLGTSLLDGIGKLIASLS